MIRIGMLIDLQSDFFLPGGVLPVRHPESAEASITLLKKIKKWMHFNLDVVIYTASWYAYTDLDINTINPDYRTTFPPHCMGNSNSPEGAFIIGPLNPLEEIPVDLDTSIGEIRQSLSEITQHKKPIVIRKNRVSLWDGCTIFQEILDILGSIKTEEPSVEGIQFFVAGGPGEMSVDKFVVRAREYNYETTLINSGIFFLEQDFVPKFENKWKTLGVGSIIIGE